MPRATTKDVDFTETMSTKDTEKAKSKKTKTKRKEENTEDMSEEQETPTEKKRKRGEKSDMHDRVVRTPSAASHRGPASPSKGGRRKGKGTGHGQTTSGLNAVYHQELPGILRAMFALEHDSLAGTECPCGRAEESNASSTAEEETSGEESADGRADEAHRDHPQKTMPRIWRCVECTDQKPTCAICLRERHMNAPFHKVQRWNGRFFERASLADVNVRVYLGHPEGVCPSAAENDDGLEFTICDVSGIHQMRVHRCACHGLGEDCLSLVEQLLSARLWPATLKDPRSAYTFQLMEHWHLDVMQGKKPVYDYWLSLQRRTKMVAKDLTGYRNFLRAGRQYRDVMSRIRSGQAIGIDDLLPPNRYPGSVAILCPACPEPGFNLPEDWRDLIEDPEERCKYIKIIGIDATFKAHVKYKRHDPDDRSLNPGSAYFVPWDEFLAYEDAFKDRTAEPEGPCPGIDGMHKAAGGRNTIVSGVVATVCARHSMFCARGIVNLRKGERFTHLDLSLRCALGPHPDQYLPLIISSDRACQLLINIISRWRDEFPDEPTLIEILENVSWAIPKLHIYGHKEDCQYLLHFLYLLDSGRTCGEGVERPWPETNATAMISKDANLGHREDILNDTHGDWNIKKLLGMADHLLSKAKEAAENVSRTKTDLDDYVESIGNDKVAAWDAAFPSEAGARDAQGHVTSRYRTEKNKLAKREELMQMIAQEERKAGGKWARGRGPTALLRRMVEVEQAQEKLRYKVRTVKDSGKAAWAAIDKARTTLRVQIKLLRPLQRQHMPTLCDLLDAEEQTSENVDEEDKPEDDPLYMPSSFPESEREENGLKKLADIEMKMRQYYAETELDLLKLAIRVYLTNVATKRRHLSGQAAQTRANAKLKKDVKRREKHIRRYRLHYDAMLALGLKANDKNFRPIDDTLADKVKDVTKPAALGGGKESDAWFWREGKDVAKNKEKTAEEIEDMNDEERRVRYFRLWAAWKRWDEEWKILGAEFDRTVKSFSEYSKIWGTVAERCSSKILDAKNDMESRILRKEEQGVPRADQGEPLEYLYKIGVAAGQKAYAYKKVDFYDGLKTDAVAKRQTAGALDNGRHWDGWKAHEKELADRATEEVDQDAEETRAKKRQRVV